MKKLITLLFLLCIQHGLSHPDVEEFCFSVMKQAQSFCSQGELTTCQGRPGKRGVAGPVGPKGEKGDIGDGDRLASQISRLKAEVEEIKRILPIPTKVDFCAMGMKDGTIPDSAISASSEYDSNHRPALGRLDNQKKGTLHGMWSPRQSRMGEWIQIDLGLEKSVSGVVTQGRPQDLSHWVTSFKVACGDSATFKTIRENGEEKVFSGNTDNGSKVVNMFPKPVSCRYIRLSPLTWHRFINMRLELLRGDCAQYF